jgi:hypothetical protein
MTESDISVAATNFVASYAKAMALGADPSNSLASVADAIASHYPLSTPFTAFTFGHALVFANRADMAVGILSHLERFVRSGLGIDISMEKSRVEVVSSGSALCWITWGIKPKDGTEGWPWENVYGYRKPVDLEGEGYWEFVVSDQEIGNLMQRKPDFMQS